MRVIRHGSGWDIALDMVFTDKTTADTIAKRIQPAVHALIRYAVDASMSTRNAADEEKKETSSTERQSTSGKLSRGQRVPDTCE